MGFCSDSASSVLLADSAAFLRAAWDRHAREGVALELVAVCPGAVLGPVLGHKHSASIDIFTSFLDGSLSALPRFGWPLADARNVAGLHIRALPAPSALARLQRRPTLSLPFFEGGQLRGKLQRQSAQREAGLNFQRTVLGAYREAGDAITAYVQVQKQQRETASAVRQDEVALQTARQAYAQERLTCGRC